MVTSQSRRLLMASLAGALALPIALSPSVAHAEEAEEVHCLDQVCLSVAVGPCDHREARPKLDVQGGEVAERAE